MSRDEALIVVFEIFSFGLTLALAVQSLLLILKDDVTGILYGAASVGIGLIALYFIDKIDGRR